MGVLGDLLRHPDEFVPLVKMALAAKKAAKLPTHPDLAFCYEILNNVSRSFAVVIQQLPNPLRDAICVFYLVLRGLDTVEDDMAIPNDIKLPALLSFHEKIYERGFTMDCGYDHYKRLMEHFGIVVNVFLGLDEQFQLVIADITKRMGAGMAEFIQREVKTVADYDKYCHYVAGLVGIGLSQLFASSGLESDQYYNMEDLSNYMGLFLQKTNIIRDYLEDILEEPAPRMFWPRAIWGQYAQSLDEFKEPDNRTEAVRCLNHMIVDALRHMPDCVAYMQGLRDPMVFRFCAIPQIMAAGTLALCYNNGKVFEGVVKMRRGETARVFDSCSNMEDLFTWFIQFLELLRSKVEEEVDVTDPTLEQARKVISGNLAMCEKGLQEWRRDNPKPVLLPLLRDLLIVLLTATYFYYAFGMGGKGLPDALKPHEWVLTTYPIVHQVVAAVIFFSTVSRAISRAR